MVDCPLVSEQIMGEVKMSTVVEQKMQSERQVVQAPPLEDSDDDHSLVSEPDESQKRYAALRNHQIRFSDAIDPNAERVYEIRDIDILLGRGRGYQNHSGNRRMRSIIENYKNRYHSLKRTEKRKLVQQVYVEVVKSGARFLKKLGKEQAWVVVDSPIAFQKVSHTMRCRKSIHKQMDVHGHIPDGVGGPVPRTKKAPPAPQVTLPLGAQYHPRNFLPVVSVTGSRTAIPSPRAVNPMAAMSSSLSTVAANLPPSTVGLSPLHATPGLAANFPPSTTGLPPLHATPGLGGYPSAPPRLADLEAQHMAAQGRFRSIASMGQESRMDYYGYEQMKKQQIIREIQVYARMGDEILLRNGLPLTTRLSDLSSPKLHPPHYHPLDPREAVLAREAVALHGTLPGESSALQPPSAAVSHPMAYY